MAKKRTKKMFYGKAEQHLEARCRDMLPGDPEGFNRGMAFLRYRLMRKASAHYAVAARKPGAPFERPTPALRALLRYNYRGTA